VFAGEVCNDTGVIFNVVNDIASVCVYLLLARKRNHLFHSQGETLRRPEIGPISLKLSFLQIRSFYLTKIVYDVGLTSRNRWF